MGQDSSLPAALQYMDTHMHALLLHYQPPPNGILVSGYLELLLTVVTGRCFAVCRDDVMAGSCSGEV